MGRKKDRSKSNETSGTNLLHLTPAWRRSKPPVVPDPVRYNAKCGKCESYFFGDTQREADQRKDSHHCFG